MKNTKIAQILNRLMQDQRIRVTELARRVSLPQPTVHRIATGVCDHPHLSSLEPIAAYFSISVDQLKGHEPIPHLDRVTKVPLLQWEDILNWPSHQAQKEYELILTDAVVSEAGYALRLNDSSMDPVFPKQTLLIADSHRKAKDRSFVIAKLAHHRQAIFRQLLIDGGLFYLKPLSPDFIHYQMTKMDVDDKILSVVVQAKRDCEIE